jgi:hypothetical protein
MINKKSSGNKKICYFKVNVCCFFDDIDDIVHDIFPIVYDIVLFNNLNNIIYQNYKADTE